jgi:hypothetical protein
MDTVAFHLYDLRKTSYIEWDEVPLLLYKIDLTMDRFMLDIRRIALLMILQKTRGGQCVKKIRI